MAIVFDWYENPNASSEEEALYPRIFMDEKMDTDTLCYKIHGLLWRIQRCSTSFTLTTVKDVKEAYFLE